MKLNDIEKLEKALVNGFDEKVIDLSVYLVQKCNFNDERLIASKVINKIEINDKDFKFFDMYLGKAKSEKQIAFVYADDEKMFFITKEKEIVEISNGAYTCSEDFDESLLIACHINVFDKKYKKKELNITAGECLNEKMKQVAELWIPFNEDMSKGKIEAELFSEDFYKERSNVHNVSIETYKEKLNLFINQLDEIKLYDKINLWFGEDACCLANMGFVYNVLINYGFKGELVVNIVDEETTCLKKRFISDFSNKDNE